MNHSAFIDVLGPLKKKAYRLALRMLENKEEAQVPVQELYFKFWKNKLKVKEYKNVEAFAMTTVKTIVSIELNLNNLIALGSLTKTIKRNMSFNTS